MFVMTRTTGVPGGEPLLEEGGGDAGGAADDQAVGGDVRGEFVEEGAHVLRLDGEDQGVGGLGGLGVGDGVDAVAGAELLGALGAAGGDEEVGRGPAAADHAAESRASPILPVPRTATFWVMAGSPRRGGPCLAAASSSGARAGRVQADGGCPAGGGPAQARAAAQGGRAQGEDEEGAAGDDQRRRGRSRR